MARARELAMDGEMDTHEIVDIEVELFKQAMELRHGFQFGGYAPASLKRRILSAANALACERGIDLVARVLHDDSVLPEVIHHLSVRVTEMFRDPIAFQVLRRDVVPVLSSFPRINVWVAGCSTGEEVYSLAILLQEEGLLDRTQIYATDINEIALAKAEEGVYPVETLQEYERNYARAGGRAELSDYYSARYNLARFNASLRRRVVFSFHNLTSDGVFCEVNLVVCRNVFIYFQATLQNHVTRLFHDSLVRGGYLWIGAKESLNEWERHDGFRPLVAGSSMYRKQPRPEVS